MRRLFAAAAAMAGLLAAACDRQREEGPNASDTLATAVVDTLTPDSLAATSTVLNFERQRSFDFDTDGTEEQIRMHATGPAWDSMTVVLHIQNVQGELLYADTISTERYTGLDPDPAMSREEVGTMIRRELERFLSSQSFVSTSENFDDANMDLRSNAPWMTDAELDRFREDLMSRPMFRYYIGGESSIGITWSGVLRKFVQTSSCC